MFYRRKVIFGLLEVFGGTLEKIRLQKLLFIVSKRQKDPTYEFIPYKFGCFSYSANADMQAMVSKAQLSETETTFTKTDKKRYLSSLEDADRLIINQLAVQFKNHTAEELMHYTYTKFPFYAVNSSVAGNILNPEELQTVKEYLTLSEASVLFTIGYEGVSLEAYLNKLITNGVKVLVDVRNNPVSQKFGFSKSQLIRYCNSLGIEYVHVPEVGIQSAKRQDLNEQKDYNILFGYYKRDTLTQTIPSQEKILEILRIKKRIALTCFEADICQCHRKPLAEALMQLPQWQYTLKHI
jgi:uncharacterized protein (DUF488 family)